MTELMLMRAKIISAQIKDFEEFESKLKRERENNATSGVSINGYQVCANTEGTHIAIDALIGYYERTISLLKTEFENM